MRKSKSWAERTWAYTDPEGDCLRYGRGVQPKGYARVTLRYRQDYAHRLAYEQHFGPIPEGHEIHHTCGTKNCINPDHLEAMTASEHARTHRRYEYDVLGRGL